MIASLPVPDAWSIVSVPAPEEPPELLPLDPPPLLLPLLAPEPLPPPPLVLPEDEPPELPELPPLEPPDPPPELPVLPLELDALPTSGEPPPLPHAEQTPTTHAVATVAVQRPPRRGNELQGARERDLAPGRYSFMKLSPDL
jgi:hypothetical protein